MSGLPGREINSPRPRRRSRSRRFNGGFTGVREGGLEGVKSVKREEIRARIEEIGILPAVRTSSAEQARFAVEAVIRGGIPAAEITMTVPGAIEVIAHFARHAPDAIVGAGTVLDVETARRCVDAGAKFLTSPGLVLDVVGFALKNDVVV